MSAADPLLKLAGVIGGYGELLILRGIEFAIRERSLTTVIGANGAGKSTLLKTIVGALPCREGRIEFAGADVTGDDAIARLRRGIGLVPQGRCNFPLMSVAENLRLGAFSRRAGKAVVAAEIERLTERFPLLRQRWRTLAGNLSGGEQQILEMAMVLMARPRLLLLDEPSLGLSPKMSTQVFEEIRRLVDEGITVLMVEQNAAEALEYSDDGIVLELGAVRLQQPAATVLEHPEIRRLFLGL